MNKETILIGDVHGCASELRALLELIAHREARVVFLGDLVNKGPDPTGVVRMIKSMECLCLKGNHDADHFKWHQGAHQPKPDTIKTRDSMSASDYSDYLDIVRGMSLYFENESLIAVHAALLPNLALNEQPEEILTGERTLENTWKDHVNFDRPLVVGHKRYSKELDISCVVDGRFYGLDTGCVYGGSMTALSLQSGAMWQVKAERPYAVLN